MELTPLASTVAKFKQRLSAHLPWLRSEGCSSAVTTAQIPAATNVWRWRQHQGRMVGAPDSATPYDRS